MDVSKLPKASKNFEDRTGWTPRDDAVQGIKNLLNPVHAYRNIRGALIEKGVVNPAPERRVGMGLPKVGGK